MLSILSTLRVTLRVCPAHIFFPLSVSGKRLPVAGSRIDRVAAPHTSNLNILPPEKWRKLELIRNCLSRDCGQWTPRPCTRGVDRPRRLAAALTTKNEETRHPVRVSSSTKTEGSGTHSPCLMPAASP